MTQSFFDQPILNSPYEYPGRHWELIDGQPTDRIFEYRRRSELITPVPKPRKRRNSRGSSDQSEMHLPGEDDEVSDEIQTYDPTPIINEIRRHVDTWRQLPAQSSGVTPETARLLEYWRHHNFQGIRPFFCQVEAVETAIWLAEIAPKNPATKKFHEYLLAANESANPELFRIALKLATGAGKTTVMAMLIAWQTLNAARHPGSSKYSKGFLIVTPGITIRDRLQVLRPNDPYSYFKTRELVPPDVAREINEAKIVITNYHAFKPRETMEVSSGTRKVLEGRDHQMQTQETEGQVLRRVMGDLMGMKNIVVLNDEAHHCYREKPGGDEGLTGDEKKEAQENTEAARLWINGLEMVKRKLGVSAVYDLSATPFFLRGSGYAEGTLFPWTVSDFSLMDAIECGIVKLPRVPVADNIPGEEVPKFRNLWDHIGKKMPKSGRGKAGKNYDPLSLPVLLTTALDALYGHYVKVSELWEQEGISVPPVFIVVCNNTASSKLVHDYIAGFERVSDETGEVTFHEGRLELFRNYDEHGNRHPKPRTLLIDSAQLESDEALSPQFREIASDEIEQFRKEIIERTGDRSAAEKISDQDLLREVMNTVGQKGRLGESVRCVVSVSMLTEGWDANTVTHILGVRAFGTQLLCEQVVGRALRRQSYELNDHSQFDVEYADILGIPFDFTAKAQVVKPVKPRETVRVYAVKERDALEIRFPRVEGYRTELPGKTISAKFTEDSVLRLTPDLTGPAITRSQGIVGEGVDLTVEHLGDMRPSTVLMHLTKFLIYEKYRDAGDEPKLYLFAPLKRIAREWLDRYLRCEGGTYPAQVLIPEIAEMAASRITAAITESVRGEKPVKAILDAYNPIGSTAYVNFTTSKEPRWETDARKCHVNWAICDSEWEPELCRVVETHPKVLSYVKNHNLGLEVPYAYLGERRTYIPDFIVCVDDGREDPLNLIVEIKGYRGEDAKEKALTMRTLWVPGVNNLRKFGRWAFAEFTSVYEIEAGFARLVEETIGKEPISTDG